MTPFPTLSLAPLCSSSAVALTATTELANTVAATPARSQKHFASLFENMLYLELRKHKHEVYFDDAIDFYLPQDSEIILSMPFADERSLFKKVETLEAFIFTYGITQITAVTMNNEATISHPFSKIEMIPFDIWALGD